MTALLAVTGGRVLTMAPGAAEIPDGVVHAAVWFESQWRSEAAAGQIDAAAAARDRARTVLPRPGSSRVRAAEDREARKGQEASAGGPD
ncbi:MAG TPA: hypothetical protein VIL36_10280 [Acidimicrobiales bacterium]